MMNSLSLLFSLCRVPPKANPLIARGSRDLVQLKPTGKTLPTPPANSQIQNPKIPNPKTINLQRSNGPICTLQSPTFSAALPVRRLPMLKRVCSYPSLSPPHPIIHHPTTQQKAALQRPSSCSVRPSPQPTWGSSIPALRPLT